jgi:hypothetical protein
MKKKLKKKSLQRPQRQRRSNMDNKIVKRWQDADKFFRSKGLRRLVCKFRNLTIKGNIFSDVRKDWVRRNIAWFSNKSWSNEFYHDMGEPGIWFHGYLPVDKAPDYAVAEDLFEDVFKGCRRYEIKFETAQQLEEFMPLFFETLEEIEKQERIAQKVYGPALASLTRL